MTGSDPARRSGGGAEASRRGAGRTLAAGLLGIALVVAGSFAFIAAMDGPAPAPAPVPPAAVAGDAPAAPLAPPAASAPPAVPAAPVGPPAPPPGPAAVARLPADLRARRAALEPLRAEVERGLAALDGRTRECGLARPELVLTLESLERRVHVADVRVRTRGPGEVPEGVPAPPAEDERAVACVRRALLDEVLDAPSSRPGRRWELEWAPGAR